MVHWFEVEDEYFRDELDLLGKKYTYKILKGLTEPTTTKELRNKYDIPQATLQRRITELREREYIEGAGVSTNLESKKESVMYQKTEKAPSVLAVAAIKLSDEDEENFVEDLLDGSDGI